MPLSYSQTYDLPLKMPGHAITLLHECILASIATRQLLRKRHHRERNVSEEIATLQNIQKDLAEFIRSAGHTSVQITTHYYGTLTLHERDAYRIKNKPQLLDFFNQNNAFVLNLPQTSISVRKQDYAPGTNIRFRYKINPTTGTSVIVNYQVKP